MATQVRFEVRPLEGITVVEFGTYLVGPLVGLHLQHLGARVISVTRPASSRGAAEEAAWRPATTAALREGKQLMELDLHSKQGADAARALLLNHADVMIENFSPGTLERFGLGAESIRKEKPSLICLSLPGFASSDPAFAAVPAWEAVIMAVSGVFRDMGVNRQLMNIPASYSPLPLASAYASVLGALSVVAALYRRNVAIKGGVDPAAAPGEAIEVPLASALLDTLVHNSLDFNCPERYLSARQRYLKRRQAGSPKASAKEQLHYEDVEELMDPFYNHYRCADGRPFYLVAPAHIRHQQNALKVLGLEAAALGLPTASPYADDEATAHGIGAGQVGDEHATRLRRAMKRAFLAKTAFDWERLFGEAGVPGAAHRTTVEWLKSPHAKEAGLVTTAEDGAVRPGPVAWVREELSLDDPTDFVESPRSPSPKECEGCLAGVRILDLANVIAGPTIGAYLARFGAEVIHVAPTKPMYSPEITVLYGMASNIGKRSIILDIKDAEGKKAFEALVAQSDLVVMNCTIACLERLGLSPSDLRRMNPRAALVRFDAWGGPREGCGPRTQHLGYDDNVQAAQGIMARFGGGLGRVEEHAHIGTIDVVAGIGGALAAAAALLQQLKGMPRGTLVARASLASLGQIVQFPFCCGQLDSLEAEAATCATQAGPECRGEHALLRCYEAGDGEWLILAASLQSPGNAQDKQVSKLAKVSEQFRDTIASAGNGILGADYNARLADALVQLFQTGTAGDWSRQLLEAGVAAVELKSLADVREANTRQANELTAGPTFQFGTDLEHPIGGPVTLFEPCSVRASKGALTLQLSPAPRYGQHTREILQEAGMCADDLISTGVASETWSKSYLPGFKPTQTLKQVPTCPVCLERRPEPSTVVELSCGHLLCRGCATRCSGVGHGNCPVCRHPHILDPECLAQRSAIWRQQYAGWRAGMASGAAGEVSSIGAPIFKEENLQDKAWVRSAGDLMQAKKRYPSSFPLLKCEV